MHCANRSRLGGRGEESITLHAEEKGENEGKMKTKMKKGKKRKKKHTNFLISFVFVFQRRKTNDMADEHEFYVL